MTQEEIVKRLQEIANTSLQDLGDEAVFAILNERKKLSADLARLEEEQKKKQEEEERLKQEALKKQEEERANKESLKKQEITNRLAEINSSITSDKNDEELLALIQERKMLEAQLHVLNADDSVPTPVPEMSVPKSAPLKEELVSKEEEPAEESEPAPVAKITINTEAPYNTTNYVSSRGRVSDVEDSGERVVLDSSLQTTEYQGYLSELKANLNSLGTFLQSLPIEAKRNRAFMLEVAKIDPAYAMHYADKDTLKKDETFNIAIAGMNNQRNTGNPLSEMLPEMRTGSVLLAGVKNDFKNVRFLRPEMPEYNEILALAQKGALEAVASLKNAHDIQFLLPPILQKDKAFMKEVEKLVSQN